MFRTAAIFFLIFTSTAYANKCDSIDDAIGQYAERYIQQDTKKGEVENQIGHAYTRLMAHDISQGEYDDVVAAYKDRIREIENETEDIKRTWDELIEEWKRLQCD